MFVDLSKDKSGHLLTNVFHIRHIVRIDYNDIFPSELVMSDGSNINLEITMEEFKRRVNEELSKSVTKRLVECL